MSIPDYYLKRTPIMLGAHTVMLLTLFHLPEDRIEDLWVHDYVDVMKDITHSAKQVITQMEGHWSPAFLMALRDEITTVLAEHDRQYGTKFSLPSPPKE